MSMIRRAKQRDENEPEIVEALQADGNIVIRIDEPCDLLVQCPCGVWVLLEVKNPTGKTGTHDREGRTKKQADLNRTLHRQIPIVHDRDEAFAAMMWDHNCG